MSGFLLKNDDLCNETGAFSPGIPSETPRPRTGARTPVSRFRTFFRTRFGRCFLCSFSVRNPAGTGAGYDDVREKKMNCVLKTRNLVSNMMDSAEHDATCTAQKRKPINQL